ncbi:MAG: response regulator [Cyclobacteriaceae bacterium]
MTNQPFLILFWALIIPLGLSAQPDKSSPKIKTFGYPFMEVYGSTDYDFGSQNFDILAGHDGKVYFANFEGILVYDGAGWTQLPLPNNTGTYSLAKAPDGTVYVGGVNEFGYLTTQANGQLGFISLKDKIGDRVNKSYTCSKATSNGNQILFMATDLVFSVDHKSKDVVVIETPYANHRTRVINQQVYSILPDSTYLLSSGKWQLIGPSKIQFEGGKIHSVEINEQRCILVSKKGFFEFHSETPIQIHPDVRRFLEESNPYAIDLMQGKYIAISSFAGFLITDLEGNPVKLLTETHGLPTDLVLSSGVDQNGVLWIGTNNGIVKAEVFSSIGTLQSSLLVEGAVEAVRSIHRHNEYLYLSSYDGIFRYKWEDLLNPMNTKRPEQLSGFFGDKIIETSKDLVFVTQQSTLVLRNDELVPIPGTEEGIFWMGFKDLRSDDLMLGSAIGQIMHLRKNGNTWEVAGKFNSSFSVAEFMEPGEGDDFWVSNRNEGLFKITYDWETSRVVSEKNYGADDGLPSNQNNFVFRLADSIYIGTKAGAYVYDPIKDQFRKDEGLLDMANEKDINRMSESPDSDIYYYTDRIYQLRKTNDGFKKRVFPPAKVQKHELMDIHALDSLNFFAPLFGPVLHIDPRHPEIKPKFGMNITLISSLSSLDSAYFGGFGQVPEITFAHDDNAMRIGFAAAYYQDENETQYRWKLNGNDWSDWSGENTKDFTNLSHGAYTFEVAAKNANGIEATPSIVRFVVATPWYFTIWAYALYTVFFLAFLWLLLKLNSRRLVREKRKLESIVQERTYEIQEQKVELEQQHNQLVQMDDLKNRFFINISHELRTPLTLIMGSIDRLMQNDKAAPDELKSKLSTSYRNSERLMKMVSNILDISKLEGGKMELYAALVNPTRALTKVSDFFTSRFHDKEINFQLNSKVESNIYLDVEKFETIFVNLLANAYKFTPEGGEINVHIIETDDQVSISVKDNGLGIEEKDVAFVFDRFYQSSHIKSGEGMGVGLALTKELVELHRGEISVASEIGKGTTFSVGFLKGRDHLTPNQIVESEIKSAKDLSDKYPLHEDIEKSPSGPELQDANGNPHILIVEDNQEMSKFIVETLGNDYQISTAGNGQQGLDFLKQHKPDLIITDYLMPIMDGYEMTTEIKKMEGFAHLPIIFLTARAREQDKINVLNLGVNDYLFKPFNAQELLVRIKNLLQMKEQRQEYVDEQSIDSIEWSDFPSTLQQQIDDYIESHIKEEITGEDLADALAQSKRSVYRKIKANTGLSVMMYIREYRLRKARTMLENRAYQTVSEVSYAVGFNYISYFTRCYKERFGKQPSDYFE